MDIDLLSKMVKELILDNDRVVLPGLGCFVAEVVPSSFSDKGYTINPPYRRLYFRSRPDEGDAIAAFYASTNNVDMEVADKVIRDFVAEMRSVLHVKKTVIFPGLGRLRATKENNVFFVADEDLDIWPEGFGLEPVSLKTHQETKEEVAAAVEDLASILTEQTVPAVPEIADIEPMAVGDDESTLVTEQEVEETAGGEPESVAEDHDVVGNGQEAAGKVADEAADEAADEVADNAADEIADESGDEVAEETEDDGQVLQDGGERNGRAVLKAVLWLVGTVVALLVAYMIIARICPEWIDSLLYTPEELEILNHR